MHQKGSARQHPCSEGQFVEATDSFRFPPRPGDLRVLARLMQFPRVWIFLRAAQEGVPCEILELEDELQERTSRYMDTLGQLIC